MDLTVQLQDLSVGREQFPWLLQQEQVKMFELQDIILPLLVSDATLV